jgi:hypothetical protein
MNFMSDDRHAQLVKAAEDCIGLMNIGVDPDAALYKLAEDTVMTDKEVELVSHAVNNSKQLAHLQISDSEDRGKPFVLTNVNKVLELRKETNDRGRNASDQKKDQPDAVEIKKNLDKTAVAASYVEKSDYRKVASEKADLRALWDIKPVELQKYECDFPYAEAQQLKLAADEAALQYLKARDEACAVVDELVYEFRKTAAPKFEVFEKAALACGVSPEYLDIIYNTAGLEKFNEKRGSAETKRQYISAELMELVKKAEHGDSCWQHAASCAAAKNVMIDRKNEAIAQVNKTAADKGGADSNSFFMDPVSIKAEMSTSGLGDLGSLPSSFIGGMDPSAMASELGGLTPSDIKAGPATLDHSTRQTMKNIQGRTAIESLMQDQYVKGHSIADVVDAYNRAISVNPGFGEAELKSFIRQDLATRGAVPLDLMLRASKNRSDDSEGDE